VQIASQGTTQPIQALLTLFENVHHCVATSSSIERDFSLYGRYQSKGRSRLATGRVAKMVKVARLLRPYADDEDDNDL